MSQQTEHTPEPWALIEERWRANVDIVDANGGVVKREVRPANARRIVSCVNALTGLNPDAVRECLEALKEAKLQLEYLNERHCVTATTPAVLNRIDQALAKLEEKQ